MTKDMIKNSIEAKWRKKQAVFYVWFLIGILVFMFFFALYSGLTEGDMLLSFKVGGIFTIVLILSFVPFSLFYLYKYIMLFRDFNDSEVYEVTLDRPSTSYWYKGAVYYTVSFVRNNNYRVSADTKPLWSSGIFSTFQLEDYNNKKIKIAYNEEKNIVMVLGIK